MLLSRAPPKRGIIWIIGIYLPPPPPSFHQTTPFANLLTVGPPPLHWLGTSWWCFGQNVVVPLLPILSSFFPTPFLPLMYGLVSFCALHSFCLCLSFMGDGMSLLGLPHFCLFLVPWVCLLLLLLAWPVGPYLFLFSFLFFLWAFSAFCFCCYLPISYYIPFSLSIGLPYFSAFFFFFL